MISRRAIAVVTAIALAAPPLAGWFSATMPRHQLLQVPAMIILGAIAGHPGRVGPRRQSPGTGWDTPIVVLAVGIVLFWMIPRSVDLAAASAMADQLMHLSWFAAGAALAHALPRVSPAVAMALGIHGVAMLAAAGLVYTLYPGLICTAYDLQQQRTTGRWLLTLAPVLGTTLWTCAILRMARPTPATAGPRPETAPATG